MTASSPALRPLTPPLMAAGPRLRVLLADDEDSLRDSLSRLLERMGHVVVAAPNGESALSLFALHPAGFDVALLDVQMPHDGVRTLRALRAVAPALPIILMSADVLPCDLPCDAQPSAFIRKPCSPAALLDALAAVTPARLAAV
jgi:CheY-like chemotaxis protein